MVEEINALKMSKEVVQQLRTLGREVTCQHGYTTCCGVYLLTNEALLEILFSKVESLESKPSGTVNLLADYPLEERARVAEICRRSNGRLAIGAGDIERLAAKLGGRVVWGQ